MYIVYGAFCVVGFVSWLRIERSERAVAHPAGVADPVVETVGYGSPGRGRHSHGANGSTRPGAEEKRANVRDSLARAR